MRAVCCQMSRRCAPDSCCCCWCGCRKPACVPVCARQGLGFQEVHSTRLPDGWGQRLTARRQTDNILRGIRMSSTVTVLSLSKRTRRQFVDDSAKHRMNLCIVCSMLQMILRTCLHSVREYELKPSRQTSTNSCTPWNTLHVKCSYFWIHVNLSLMATSGQHRLSLRW